MRFYEVWRNFIILLPEGTMLLVSSIRQYYLSANSDILS
ncbi:hypothetical protein BAAA27672_07255 [Bifidobacterium animalis subsp. animalis ATCC 27672]|nr:hypothetical protein BAAA27672_07255 [Bifidobacterium animalis subsp. animalis ATCC 27672]